MEEEWSGLRKRGHAGHQQLSWLDYRKQRAAQEAGSCWLEPGLHPEALAQKWI